MRKLLNKKFIFIGTGSIFFITLLIFSYLLATDDYENAKFRTMQNEISPSEQVDLTGLHELQASGGPSVNFPDLKRRLQHIQQKIIIVDSVGQDHGYIGENPTSFFGYRSKDVDIRHFIRRLVFTGTLEERPDLIVPEIQKAQKYGFGYKSIKIESKVISTNDTINAFVDFIDTLPENTWLHFHCRLGKGRTSMMLSMYDIMKNAPKVALEDILKRQHLLGSVNLSDTIVWKIQGTYSSKTLQRRKKFIEDFYAFICQRKAGGIQQWSSWRNLKFNNNILPRNLDKK